MLCNREKREGRGWRVPSKRFQDNAFGASGCELQSSPRVWDESGAGPPQQLQRREMGSERNSRSSPTALLPGGSHGLTGVSHLSQRPSVSALCPHTSASQVLIQTHWFPPHYCPTNIIAFSRSPSEFSNIPSLHLQNEGFPTNHWTCCFPHFLHGHSPTIISHLLSAPTTHSTFPTWQPLNWGTWLNSSLWLGFLESGGCYQMVPQIRSNVHQQRNGERRCGIYTTLLQP